VEALLLGAAEEGAPPSGLPVTLVLGLPGSDLTYVASGLCAALPEGARVALIPGRKQKEELALPVKLELGLQSPSPSLSVSTIVVGATPPLPSNIFWIRPPNNLCVLFVVKTFND